MINPHQFDWSKYPNFLPSEFVCKETGKEGVRQELISLLQDIRLVYDRPMPISSGYRDRTHSLEIVKEIPGEHTLGLAADIKAHGSGALDLIQVALAHGVSRIGISQRGDYWNRFIHIGIADKFYKGFVKGVWSY